MEVPRLNRTVGGWFRTTVALRLREARLLVLVGAAAVASSDALLRPSATAIARPNIVVVMTDDQDVASMRVMKHTRNLIQRRGTSFVNSYVTTPLCCPSRATFHTGRYTHNHRVVSNDGSRGGAAGFSRLVRPRQTLAVRMRRAGYRTGYVGKYLNNPGGDGYFNVPPGWNRWFEMTLGTTYRMYDFVLNANGRPQHYGRSPQDYQTDVLARKALRFVSRSARGRKPFFLMLGTVAPHRDHQRLGAKQNPLAAPRHSTRFNDARLRRSPSFNERRVSDKPRFIRRPKLSKSQKREIRAQYRSRLESLLAVDEAVARIGHRLRRTGERNETVLIFTSDNGYLLGEHRLTGKALPYEEAAGVPLLLRGPGIPRGVRRTQIVGNVDVAPTILDLANGSRARMDGRSLLPLVRDADKGHARDLLIEVLKGSGYRPLKAVRSGDRVLVNHRGRAGELYDLGKDPFQLDNRYFHPAYRKSKRKLRARIRQLADCRRSRCR
jgi:N-acetylglucosamine-6-sulfatase